LNQYYAELFTEDNILRLSNGTIDPEKIAYLCEYSTQLFKKKKVEMEDYAALGYLKYKIFGFEKKIEVKSVVIDEAQDYSLFQLYTLKTIINTSRFTLLGDLSQGIHSYRSINTWEGVVEKIFGVEESNFMTLEQSYRTTIEVMQLANEIIKKLNSESIVLAKPVIRHGKPAEHKEFTKDEDLIVSLEDTIVKMKSAKYKSIAVICKTEDECKSVKKYMEASGNIKSRILDEKQMQYEAGVILVPVHLAKGLEFDVVFIVNLEESYMEEELDFKLLYVCMTRTLHRLFIYNKEGKIPMLKGINHLKENN
jgi:DNA helicase-2/ATP-dependent DNA helicase PcrA